MKNLLFIIVFFSVIIQAKAQSGEIRGRVTDQASAYDIKAAQVKVTDSLGKTTGKEARTDGYGNFQLGSIIPGTYNLELSYKGYEPQTIRGIIVSADKSTFINISLKPKVSGRK